MAADGAQVRLAVIGCGRWGPNHIRVFSESDRATVVGCADISQQRRENMLKRFPQIRAVADYHELLADESIDAVVIATPTFTHAQIAREALQAGKHVLAEKPICATTREAAGIVRLAEDTGLVFMVGHVFLFNNGITELRKLVESGELGRIHYMEANRTNLGPIRGDVNALYDLATHDISIFNYLIGCSPVEVSAVGRCISQKNIEDVCFATLKYPDGTLGHIHVSWLNPRKVRTMTVVGDRQMAYWDDIDPDNTLRLYDKGIDQEPHYDSFGEFRYLLRSGDMHVPAIRQSEPLVNQAQAFLDWVLGGKRSLSDARYGLEVVAVLEAATRSMAAGGTMCRVEAEVPEALCEVA
ncbi:MAG TPA: Gfo/Idh/MocA family oxidoreductase [Phycisphaerae bacterium]|nr:Gfo/Idh/MocA family oxidoreductase [Phycisphaerae bacterium]HRR85425.1 Gfo/Idh/MocA family oxidoreductase [Phycisphaerae bacterium]